MNIKNTIKCFSIVGTMIVGAFSPHPVHAVDSAQFPISKQTFKKFFPNANAVFTYEGLIQAAAKYPSFLNQGSEEQVKSELVAFLANAAHETTGGWPTAPGGPYAWGLYFAQEVGCESGHCTQYTDPTSAYKPVAGQTYHGRGAMQLSWNYNYGQASEAIYGNANKLLQEPGLVATDPVLAWETAIWFWMTPQAPKPSAHEVVMGDPAAYKNDVFGETVNIINGGIECGHGMNPQLENRIGFYKHFAQLLGISVPTHLGEYCQNPN
ncbi:chitinase [Legionella oakridgensis]|nr:chitinase [Legionella oakridgensis]